jgi:hypothetical protein
MQDRINAGGKNPNPPGQGYHNETYAPKPVKPEDALNRWDDFPGPGPIQISIQELDYQTQTESYQLTVREVSVMVTMK